MEERIIDDEYARGIRLKKTKDGYVDVTDEEAEKATESGLSAELVDGGEGETEEGGEEVTFEFPDLAEDDEDLVNLSPEEAVALRRKKEEEAAHRKAEYERLCDEGDGLLQTGNFKAAESKFEEALSLDEEAAEAAFGYWRAKTSDFTDPDALGAEYRETGFESLENDLGERATQMIRERYGKVFAAKMKELDEEEEPLAKKVTELQEKRRGILKERIRKSVRQFIVAAVPTLLFLILTVVFATRISTRRDGLFVILTVIAGVLLTGSFVFFCVSSNQMLNVLRINRANEATDSTEDGKRLLTVRAYKELYQHFVG